MEQEARHNIEEMAYDQNRRSRRHSSVGGSQGFGYLSAPEGGRRRSRRRSSVSSIFLDSKKRLDPPKSFKNPNSFLFSRSVSAQPQNSFSRDEDTIDTDVDGRDGVMRHLKSQFQSYSKLGDRRSDGSHISCSQSDKWLKQVLKYLSFE